MKMMRDIHTFSLLIYAYKFTYKSKQNHMLVDY